MVLWLSLDSKGTGLNLGGEAEEEVGEDLRLSTEEAIVEVTITEVTEAEVDTTKTVGVIIPEATQILADATEEIQTEGSIIRKNLKNLPQVRPHFLPQIYRSSPANYCNSQKIYRILPHSIPTFY